MNVLHPTLLAAGLACVALPILIHLLMRRRRKPIPWAAMRFLVEALRRHRRRLRLEQLLLLAVRCLLVALVAIAVARPILGPRGSAAPGPQTLFLVIDNSLTASLMGEDGRSALDRHKDEARKALASLDGSRGDRAGLVAAGAQLDPVVMPPTFDINAVARALAELPPADSAADIPGALQAVRDAAADAPAPVVVLCSDLLEGSVGTMRALPDLPGSAEVRVASAPPESPENISVVSLAPLRPVALAPLKADPAQRLVDASARVALRRSGSNVARAAQTEIRVRAEDEVVGRALVDWAPGQEDASTIVRASWSGKGPAARARGEVVLSAEIDPDSLPADDRAWGVLRVRESLLVALVSTPGARRVDLAASGYAPADWVRLALAPAGEEPGSSARELEVVTIEPRSVDDARLAGVDAALVIEPRGVGREGWEALARVVRRGGVLVVSPDAAPGAQTWTDGFVQSLGLDWTFAREPTTDDARTISSAPSSGRADLLWYIRAEIDELARGVGVRMMLGVDAPGATTLLSASDGAPVLLAGAPPGDGARGLVVYMSSALDLEWTDLPARPLMVPLWQEVVRAGVSRTSVREALTSGAGVPGGGSAGEEIRGVVGPGAGGGARALGAYGPRRAGVYEISDVFGMMLVPVNVDPDAGRVGAVGADRLAGWLGHVGEVRAFGERAGRAAPGELRRAAAVERWGLLAFAAALGIALVELVLARWVSHAWSGGGEGRAAGGARA